MGTLRVNSLHWAAGALLAVFGALVLVAPHHFASPAYAPFQPSLGLWGASFLAVGMALIATIGADPRRPWGSAAGVAAGAVLLLLASGFWRTRGWTGVVVYGVLGLGCLVATLPTIRVPRRDGADLFALVTGVSCALNGLLIFAIPTQFSGLFYDQMRPYLLWNGLAFLAGGVALLAVTLAPAVPRWLFWAGHLLAAFAYWLWLATNALPLWVLTGVVYYGAIGLTVAMLPWLGPRLERLDASLLRVRLGLVLALSAALPLILTLAVVTQRQEEQAIERALATQQATAGILAQDISTYVDLHRGAILSLAGQPALPALPPAEQRGRLDAVRAAFPDFSILQTFDAAGNAVVRSDGLPLSPPLSELPMFAAMRGTGRPVVTLMVGRVSGRPLVLIGAPVLDAAGAFGGAVVGAIDTDHVAGTLHRVGGAAGAVAALVDAEGRLVAQPGAPAEAIFADRSASPPVAALIAAGQDAGALRYQGDAGDALAGYARVPGLGWGVTLEQPARAALAAIYTARDVAFIVLAVLLAAAIALGVGIAYQLTRPLSALAVAAEQFADQDAHTPLPTSSVREVADLTAIFARMRERLAARTAERDALYAAERAARQQAEQAVKMREVFLSIAAHELRNPLTPLLGQAQLLRRRRRAGDTMTERDERAIDTLVAQGRRLERLISGLLDLSRLEQGQLQLQRAPLDLAELAERVVAEVQPTAPGHSVSYQGPAAPLLVLGDAIRLEQMLLNLLQNAIRYSPEGGAVTLRLAGRDGLAVLSVSDQGIGIPADELPRLFQRFARASNADAQQIEGTGLGLYVVAEIARLHGGSVQVASKVGAGSTFTVTLPLRPAAAGAALVGEGAGPGADEAPPL
jgi:signal transduction histidine kinase